MALAVDDELVPDVDEPVVEGDRSASPRGRKNVPAASPIPVDDHSQTELGVVVVPGRSGTPDTVGGYFFTLDEEGRIINPTSISTARILEAARETGLPIYVRSNGKVLQARLDASGHSLTPISPIVPNGELLRSMALSENDQHAYLDRHLERLDEFHHISDSLGQQPSVKPLGRPALPPQAFFLPSLPSAPKASPLTAPQPPPAAPSGSISVSVPDGSEGTVTVEPSVSVVESVGDAGQPVTPISASTSAPSSIEPSIELTDEEVASPLEDEDTVTAVSPRDIPTPLPPPSSSVTPPIDVPSTPQSPQVPTGGTRKAERVSTYEPLVMPSSDEEHEPSRPEIRQPDSAVPLPPTAQPQYGRRPRRAKSTTAPSAVPQQITGVDTLAPSSPTQPVAGETSAESPKPITPRSRVTDHQVASRPMVDVPRPPSGTVSTPSVGESAIDVEQASPAIAAGGARRRPSPLKPTLVQSPVPRPGAAPIAVTGEPGEELDQANAAPELLPMTPPAEVPPEMVGGGVLEGVVDTPEAKEAQEAAWKKELAQQQLELRREGRRGVAANDLGYTRGIDRPSLANGDSYDALKAESDKAQNLLPINEPVRSAFGAQVPENLQARAARFAQLQTQRQARAGKVTNATEYEKTLAREATAFLKAAYKRTWHMAQEAAEDTALSFGDFFILSGPVVIALYAGRWVFGNMMGNLFTRQITVKVPPIGKNPAVSTTVDVHLVPAYEIGDLLDYVRHMKFILVAAITLMVYGFMAIVLYYTFRPEELLKLGMSGLEILIGLLTP